LKGLAVALVVTLASTGAASAEGYYLVLLPQFTEQSSLIVPRPYRTRDECVEAARTWKRKNPSNDFVCIPAP
jgi:hypothetical protein